MTPPVVVQTDHRSTIERAGMRLMSKRVIGLDPDPRQEFAGQVADLPKVTIITHSQELLSHPQDAPGEFRDPRKSFPKSRNPDDFA